MKYGSLFAGIGGFDLGLERAGMECKWQVEIDPFCLKVLEKHWPTVRRFQDVREVHGNVAHSENREQQEQSASHHRRPSEASFAIGSVVGAGGRMPNGDSSKRSRIGRGTTEAISYSCPSCLPAVDLTDGGQVRERRGSIRDGDVDSGLSEILRHISSVDVEDSSTKRVRVPKQLTLWGGEPLPPGNESIGQGDQYLGNSDATGDINAPGRMPGVREVGDVQGREKHSAGASPRLRKTAGSDVAMPEMPSQMAQEIQSKGGDAHGTHSDRCDNCLEPVDVIVGGFP
jgi:hypothetical protein